MINPNKFANQKMQEFGQTAFDIQQFEENNMQMRQGVNKIQSLDSPVPPPGSVPESPYGDITVNPIMQQDLKKRKIQGAKNDPKLEKGSDDSYGISGYVNTKKEYKQALQEKNHPNVYVSKPPLNVNLDPNKYKYKKGELVDTDDFNESTFNSSRKGGSISYPDIHTRDYSDVQEDDKGQYMTSLGSGEFFNDPERPTSSTHKDFVGKIVERDTLRPTTGKKFASTFLPSAKNRDEAFKIFRNNN